MCSKRNINLREFFSSKPLEYEIIDFDVYGEIIEDRIVLRVELEAPGLLSYIGKLYMEVVFPEIPEKKRECTAST